MTTIITDFGLKHFYYTQLINKLSSLVMRMNVNYRLNDNFENRTARM